MAQELHFQTAEGRNPESQTAQYYDGTVAYYDGISEGYDELHFSEQIEKFKVIREHMLIPDNSKVLDVGCGTFFSDGYFKWNMWGIEPSSKMVDIFRRNNPSKKDRICVGFAEEIERVYGPESFDAIICVSVVHHFEKPSIVFTAMKRVCRPRGKICITLLKKTKGFDTLKKAIEQSFEIIDVIDSRKDLIFICLNE